MVTPRNQLQRKLQKKLHDYSQKPINDLIVVPVNPSPKLTDQGKKSVMNSFDSSYLDHCIETNTKRILNHVLKRWN